MQENSTLESSDSHVWCRIPSRLSGHGHEALDIFETTYNQEVFHIAWTIANSQVHYSTIYSKQRKCEAKITKCSSCSLVPMFYGWFKLATNKKARYKAMWFCLDDKDQCVSGDVQDFVKGKLQVPTM